MKKNRFKCIVLVLLCVLCLLPISLPAFAAEIGEEPANREVFTDSSNTDVTPKPNDSTGTPEDLSSAAKITGYTIYNEDGTSRVNVMQKGQWVIIKVHIAESREEALSYEPTAVVNTSSFRPNLSTANGDAAYSATSQRGIYTLSFSCQYTGKGNTFGFDLSYPNSDVEMKYVSMSLNQCVEYVEPEATPKPDPTPEPEITVKGTGFALKSLNYGSQTIYAGDRFELQVALLATKGDYAVEGISISAVLPAQLISADGDMVQYIGTVQPGNEMSASFQLSANAAAEQGSYSVTINVRGMSSEDGTEITSSVEISIPIKQAERFEISKINLPEQLNSTYDDGQGYTGVYFVNKGKTPIYNITVSVQGDNLAISEGAMFFGNLEPGKEGNVDCNLLAKEAGTLAGTVSVTYENAQGVTNEVKREFTVKAGAGAVLDSANTGPINVEITDENPVPAWIWVVIGMAVVFLFSGIRYFMKKKRAEQLALLEEGTPDDNY